MRTSVLSWGTITYTHTIFFTSISSSTGQFFRISQIAQFSGVLARVFLDPEAPKFFISKAL